MAREPGRDKEEVLSTNSNLRRSGRQEPLSHFQYRIIVRRRRSRLAFQLDQSAEEYTRVLGLQLSPVRVGRQMKTITNFLSKCQQINH